MLPIFKDYRKMLLDNGLDLSEYDENKLWVDRLIIRGISKKGEIKKICRLKVTDELEYEYKFYSDIPKNEELETWEETYLRIYDEISDKEIESDKIIKEVVTKYYNDGYSIIIPTSMGKDSKLTEYLYNQSVGYIEKEIIFNNTTMDSAEVYKEVLSRPEINIVTVKNSDGTNKSFYNMVKKHGLPNRTLRWCCDHFKEGGTAQYMNGRDNLLLIMGMRNEESSTRSNYDFLWKNIQWENDTWQGLLPIRKWTELELWLYTIHNNIPINQKYKMGYSRVGCAIACPFYTKSTWVLDKYWYPTQFKRFHNILDEDFTKGEKWCRLNCTQKEYHTNWNGGLVRKEPTEEVIEEFCEYKGFNNTKLAEQYFSKDCVVCGKSVRKKDEIAMNLKLMGRGISKFKCKKHLMQDMNWSKEDWDIQVEKFKQQGCNLF
jgi:3'-phosphoadenosine 5'-phosphosulfate sulfotransferase (PAPS reductase)/FAD synthetase